MTQMSGKNSSSRPGDIRIVGGLWRGQRISVHAGSDIRPTGDRIRETLFNWLIPVIDGMRCLDLFAGTGALGLEALSRGASEAWFVERHRIAADDLEQVIKRFECENAVVVNSDAIRFLGGEPTAFNLVFLDPPFTGIDMENLCKLLDEGWLQDRAYIYIEMRKRGQLPKLPLGWQVFREKVAGEVRFALAQRP
jgi:16S rRNA (guanine966-N2)-methyltransferase